MLDDAPQPRVVLADPLGHIGDRHRLGQRQHVGFKQQREPGARASPWRSDLAHAALRTRHPRHTRVQQRAMLEEVQMPPRLVLRVVDRAALASAFRAGEPAPARKIHVQIELAILDRKLAARHLPRRRQTQGQLKKIGVSHPRSIFQLAKSRTGGSLKIPRYPHHSARSQISARCGNGPGPSFMQGRWLSPV